jgi:hypothetical protein
MSFDTSLLRDVPGGSPILAHVHCARCGEDFQHDCVPLGHKLDRIRAVLRDGTIIAPPFRFGAEIVSVEVHCACGVILTGCDLGPAMAEWGTHLALLP